MILILIALLLCEISHAFTLSCLSDETAVACKLSPCDEANNPTCINYPTALCRDYLCDSCDMRWSAAGKTIYTAEDCGICSDFSEPVTCLVAPCNDLSSKTDADKVCSTDSTLKCVDDYCGGCNFYFTDGTTTKTAEECGYGTDTTTDTPTTTNTAAKSIGCDTCASGVFTDGCNDCYCSVKGEEICTERTCVWAGIASCYDCDECPNGYFDGCNQCSCEKGVTSCTEKYCDPWGIPSCDPSTTSSATTTAAADTTTPASTSTDIGCDTCASGVFTDGCNDCYCSEKGEEVCTERTCVWAGIASCYDCDKCPNGYFDGCNQCSCSEKGGLAACTKKDCDPWGYPSCYPSTTDSATTTEGEATTTDPSTTDSATTTEGEATTTAASDDMCDKCDNGLFNDGCNNCYCAADGTSVCDENICKMYLDPYCINCDTCNDGYYDGCNKCICTEKGTACTEMGCTVMNFPYCTYEEDTTTEEPEGDTTTDEPTEETSDETSTTEEDVVCIGSSGGVWAGGKTNLNCKFCICDEDENLEECVGIFLGLTDAQKYKIAAQLQKKCPELATCDVDSLDLADDVQEDLENDVQPLTCDCDLFQCNPFGRSSGNILRAMGAFTAVLASVGLM